jgi:hypothetical protein
MSQVDNPDSLDAFQADEKGAESLPVLLGGFVVAFALACFAALVIGHYALKAPRSLIPSVFNSQSAQQPDEPSFDPFVVASPGAFLKALGGERLNPVPGEDYLLFVWLRLRRIPQPGEVLGVASKFDPQVPNKPGYALSLEGALDGVRPKVYLSAASAQGRWFTFAAHPLVRGTWYMFALSISQDSYVSVHLAQLGSDQPPVLLGGYEMRLPSLPLSSSDVAVGSIGAGRFRGQVGPFGIISARKLQRTLVDQLAQMQVEPLEVPSGVDREAVLLWANPQKDSGPLSFSVEEGVQVDPQLALPPQEPVKAGQAAKKRKGKKHVTPAKVTSAKAKTKKSGAPQKR